MDYKDIERVNSEIAAIDMHGKPYVMVPDRVKAFRKLFPEGFIRTEIIHINENSVLMQARAGYYREDGSEVILGTGYAKEDKGRGVNMTNHIENCETSAVGRALGFIALGTDGGGICSAEELVNALIAQDQLKAEEKKAKKQEEENQKIDEALKKAGRKVPSATAEVVSQVPGW